MVTEQELEILLKAHGWYLSWLPAGKSGRYAYAKRRQGTQVLTRYLKAEHKLADLTEQDVLRRISK